MCNILNGTVIDDLGSGLVLGEGQQPSFPQLGELGSIVILSGVRGGAPTAQRLSTIFRNQDGLSCC